MRLILHFTSCRITEIRRTCVSKISMHFATYLEQSVRNNLMRFVCVLKEGFRVEFCMAVTLIIIKCMMEVVCTEL